MLARNSDLQQAVETIENIERKFNQWFHYPVLFLNDREWTPHSVEVLNRSVSGPATFDVIPQEVWSFPDSMDTDRAKKSIKEQGKKGIWKAGKESYHHMCRFYSG